MTVTHAGDTVLAIIYHGATIHHPRVCSRAAELPVISEGFNPHTPPRTRAGLSVKDAGAIPLNILDADNTIDIFNLHFYLKSNI